MEAETLGDRIRRERLRLGLRQSDLADAARVGHPYVSKLEAGRENPSDELVIRIANALGVEEDEMMLAARRLPRSVAERFAVDPAAAVQFLRSWDAWLEDSER